MNLSSAGPTAYDWTRFRPSSWGYRALRRIPRP